MRIILIRFNLQDYVKSSALQRLIDTLKIQVKKKEKRMEIYPLRTKSGKSFD